MELYEMLVKWPFWPHLSIFLEGIAYFLVTLDLYGEVNLDKLCLRLKRFDRLKLFKNEAVGVVILVIFTLMVSTITTVKFNKAFNIDVDVVAKKWEEGGWRWGRSMIWEMVKTEWGVMINVFPIFLLLYLLLFPADVIFNRISKISNSKLLSGHMMSWGTILFIVSKLIALWKA